MGESRKQFEAWLMEKFGYREDYLDYWRGDGDFKHHPVLRARFEGWQASRAAIEIELPDELTIEDCIEKDIDVCRATQFNLGMGKLEQAIRAAGIKVKGA